MIDRRRFLLTSLAGACATPFGAEAQRRKIPRLCFVTFDPGTAEAPARRFEAFFQELKALGYTHADTLTIDYLAPNSGSDEFPALVQACLQHKPDIIAVTTTPAAHALKAATATTPVVMVALGDPVGTGLVDSLARPGGNLTGMSQMTSGLAVKRLEVLKAAMPSVSRVLVLAYLVDPISPLQVKALQDAAPSLGVTLLVRDVRTPDDLPAAFEDGARERAQAVLPTAESIFRMHRNRVTDLAARYRLPAVYPYAAFVRDGGGLIAYEVDDADLHRRAAGYVDKILRGAKPVDLAVQQPTKFNLLINLKTAKMLGLAIPPSLLARADQVIQ